MCVYGATHSISYLGTRNHKSSFQGCNKNNAWAPRRSCVSTVPEPDSAPTSGPAGRLQPLPELEENYSAALLAIRLTCPNNFNNHDWH